MEIKQTLLSFTLPLDPDQVHAFRGAMAQKAGLENDLFHNHDNREGMAANKFHHRYPLIQYGTWRRHALIIGLQEGSDELHRFIDRYDGSLRILREEQTMKIKKHRSQTFELALTPEFHQYRIRHWLLREEKMTEWQENRRYTQKLQVLEQWLASSILGFATGVGWQIPGKFELHLEAQPTEQHILRHHKLNYIALDVDIAANLLLPPLIGLGKSASEGFGKLLPKNYAWTPE